MNMYAADYIKMSEGFHASEGSKFHAHIESVVTSFNANERLTDKEKNRLQLNHDDFFVSSFPNPFSSNVTISVNSEYSSSIDIDLYDNIGRIVKRLLQNAPMLKGTTNYYLKRSDLPLTEGIYTCVISSSQCKKAIKLICIN